MVAPESQGKSTKYKGSLCTGLQPGWGLGRKFARSRPPDGVERPSGGCALQKSSLGIIYECFNPFGIVLTPLDVKNPPGTF